MHNNRTAHIKKNLSRAKSSVHACLTRPRSRGLEPAQQGEFDQHKIACGIVIDRDDGHVRTPSDVSRGVICYVV